MKREAYIPAKRRFARGKASRSFLSLLLLALMVAPSSVLHAAYSDAINASALPKEFGPFFVMLKRIEPYADTYRFGPWHLDVPKEKLVKEIRDIYSKGSAISRKNQNEELFLCLGLTGFFGHNLDMPGFDDHAVENFNRSIEMTDDDYRPLWLLGMHLSKATHTADGMKLLLEAEARFHPSNPGFWMDYAIAADIAGMPEHALFAVSKLKELKGKADQLDKVIVAPLKSVMKTPDRKNRIDRDHLWQLFPKGELTTIVSFPFGYKLTVPDSRNVGLSGYDGKGGGMKIPLKHRTGKTGREFVPNMFINTVVAPEGETLSVFTKRLMNPLGSWEKADFGLKLNELAYIGKSGRIDAYRGEGGGRLALITFEREAPAMSGFVLEEPQDFPKGGNAKESPLWCRYKGRTERFKERLFYMIMLEAPASVFDESLQEFMGLLKTLAVE